MTAPWALGQHADVPVANELLLLLRCPECGASPLRGAEDGARCPDCGRRFAARGYLDARPEPGAAPGAARSAAGLLMQLGPVARIYEHVWRPLIVGAVALWSVPFDSEWFIARHALGVGERRGPWLDLSCGPGLYSRRMAAAAPDEVVVGLDLSEPMLDRAVASRPAEARHLHFVRGDAHALPLRDGAFAGVINGSALHLYARPERALREVWRVLAPGGIYVASTVVRAYGPFEPALRLTGVRVWRAAELRAILEDAGFVDYQEARLRGVVMLRVRRPR